MDLDLVMFLPVIIVGTLAGIFWLVALVLFIRSVRFGTQGLRVQGRVTGHGQYTSRRRGHARLMYSAIYEATVPDGRTLQCRSGVGTSWKTPPVGAVVTLLFRPQDPERPLAPLGFSRFVLCIVFAGVAVMMTVVALSVGATLSTTRDHMHPYFPQPGVQAPARRGRAR